MEKLLFIGMLILLVAGFVRCLQIAIRAFVGNRFWKGMGLLLLSLVIGAFVLGNTIIPYSIFKQRKDIARRISRRSLPRWVSTGGASPLSRPIPCLPEGLNTHG